MKFAIEKLNFKKDSNNICRASAKIGGQEYDVTLAPENVGQAYYMTGDQATPELKTAFHVAGLLFEKLSPGTDYLFTIPYEGDAPELWVGDTAYYGQKKYCSNLFQDVLQGCLDAIHAYQTKSGSKLSYEQPKILTA